MKKMLSSLLVCVMLLTTVPMGAVALSAATSGTTGDCTWTLDGTHLTISGKGAMEDYDCWSSVSCTPWGTDITSVTIGDNVTAIGQGSFFLCRRLVSVQIGSSVTSIGAGAFASCSSLTSLSIPASVNTIGDYAINSCESLTAIHITDLSAWCEMTFGECANPLIEAQHLFLNGELVTDLIVPNGVTSVKNSTFAYYNKLTSVTLPYSVTTIEKSAFTGCEKLTSITLPISVTTIADWAFASCSSLERVYYSGREADRTSVTIGLYNDPLLNASWWYRYGQGQTPIKSGTTGDCDWMLDGTHLIISGNGAMADYTISDASPWGTEITSIVIEEGVTAIGEWAFKDCFELENVYISESVTTIGTRAFSCCGSLKCVEISKNVTEIGALAFYGCFALERISVDTDNEYYYSDDFGILFDKSITTLIKCPEKTVDYSVPSSVTNIAAHAFASCSILKSIVVPVSVLKIGAGAFNGCGNLKYVFYLGDHKSSIFIDDYNTDFKAARWHYNMSDHDYVLKVEKESTCGVSGTGYEECTVCYAKRNEGTVIPPTGNHVYGSDCDPYCWICRDKREPPHDYDDMYDSKCNLCGALRKVPQHPDEPADRNWFVNGDFETGTADGWRTWQSTKISTDAAKGGSFGAHLKGNGGWGNLLDQTIVVEAGKEYKLSFWINVNAVGVNVQVMDGSCTYIKSAWLDGNKKDYHVEWTFVAPDDFVFVNFCGSGSNTAEDVYVDNFVLVCLPSDTVPDHVYDNACDATCNECGATRTASDHVYDNDHDADCNTCGAIRDVATHVPGDIDGDGKVNNRDLAALQQYLNGEAVEVDEAALDVTGDARINNRDLATLQRYLNGWDVELH